MAIDSVLNPVGMAKKLSVGQLQKAIQDGLIPAYVGIPVLQEKVQMEQRMRGAAAQPQQNQPSVAQEVMAQAQGLESMPSNLPTQYAGGGIVAFARGGIPDIEGDMFDEDAEEDFQKELNAITNQMSRYRQQMEEMRDADQVVNLPGSLPSTGVSTEEVRKGISVKEGDRPAKTVEQSEKRVTKPAGLEDLLAMIQKKEKIGRAHV